MREKVFTCERASGDTPDRVTLTLRPLPTIVFPRIDGGMSYDDPVEAGDQLALSDSIVFTPTTGWNVETGLRVGQEAFNTKFEDAVVTRGGVRVFVKTGDFKGTPTQLVRQIETVNTSTIAPSFQLEGEPTTVTTTSGEVGVVQPYGNLQNDGLVAAFVIDGTGVELSASGPSAQMRTAADDIKAMVLSIRTSEENAS